MRLDLNADISNLTHPSATTGLFKSQIVGRTRIVNFDLDILVFFRLLSHVFPAEISSESIDFPSIIANEKDEVLGREESG